MAHRVGAFSAIAIGAGSDAGAGVLQAITVIELTGRCLLCCVGSGSIRHGDLRFGGLCRRINGCLGTGSEGQAGQRGEQGKAFHGEAPMEAQISGRLAAGVRYTPEA